MEHSPLIGCSILVVESEPIIALGFTAALERAGAETMRAESEMEALHFIDHAGLSAVVLGSAPRMRERPDVAARLEVLGVPFVFCREADGDRRPACAPVLRRPVSGKELVELLRKLLRGAAPGTIESADGSRR